MRPALLSIVLLLCSATGYLKAQPECRSTLPVIALDQKTGAPIDSLAAGDFQARFKGREIPIRTISNPPPTRRLVFVLDRSGSITKSLSGSTDSPKIVEDQSLNEILSAIPNSYLVAYLEFAGKSSRQTEFLPPDSAKTKLGDIFSWKPEEKGGFRTPLWDNIELASKLLNIRAPGDTVIVISDGGDNTSKLSLSRLENNLLAAGIPVFAIVITSGPFKTPEERTGPSNLADLAETTGGALVTVAKSLQSTDPNGQTPFRGASQLLSLLAHQYFLTIDAPDIRKAEEGRLTVNTRNTGRKMMLLYPRYLCLCDAVQ
jgi:hypothetical protein